MFVFLVYFLIIHTSFSVFAKLSNYVFNGASDKNLAYCRFKMKQNDFDDLLRFIVTKDYCNFNKMLFSFTLFKINLLGIISRT